MDDAPGPLPAYRRLVAAGRLAADDCQRLAAERLQDLWTKLRLYDPPPRQGFFLSRLLRLRPAEGADAAHPNGLYLVGEVGRGKSMLMDLFFAEAEVPRKLRRHFDAFMQDVHARMQAARAAAPEGADPIPALADAIAAEAALLCFDEFQINDIADALILGRLFEALFARGVVVVATSNTAPDHLFRGKPGRDAFLPFIDILKRHLEVLVLEGGEDYRRRARRRLSTWHVPADARAAAALDAAFAALSDAAPAAPRTLRVLGRTLTVPRAAADVARFDFDTLCRGAHGPADYLALATHFGALVLDAIPCLDTDSADATRRFITLIDALYEHHVTLVASAAAPPDALAPAAEFARTASRLIEMQTADYRALPHLN